MVAIGTLTYARRLEKAGVPREQAEAHAEAVHALVREEVATKADVLEVKRNLQEVETRLKAEIRRVGSRPGDKFDEAADRLVARLDAMERRITIKLGAITLASMVVSVTTAKFF